MKLFKETVYTQEERQREYEFAFYFTKFADDVLDKIKSNAVEQTTIEQHDWLFQLPNTTVVTQRVRKTVRDNLPEFELTSKIVLGNGLRDECTTTISEEEFFFYTQVATSKTIRTRFRLAQSGSFILEVDDYMSENGSLIKIDVETESDVKRLAWGTVANQYPYLRSVTPNHVTGPGYEKVDSSKFDVWWNQVRQSK